VGVHVSLDPVARTIELLTAPVGGFVEIGVARDIYSEAKEDWLTTAALRKLRFPLRDPITAIVRGVQVGPFVFVDNNSGWRLLPYDADHELTLNGDLFPLDEGLPLFIPRAGRTILIYGYLSAKTQTALVAGNAPWTSAEKSQIRYVLGVDGDTAATTEKPGLVNDILDEDVSTHVVADSVGLLISALARLPGLMRENTFMDETVYDVGGQLRTARLRCFDSKTNADAATDGGEETTGLIATYAISAEWPLPGRMSEYRMTLEP
jgi:hypothetical protein